jgi:hypothetical protein
VGRVHARGEGQQQPRGHVSTNKGSLSFLITSYITTYVYFSNELLIYIFVYYHSYVWNPPRLDTYHVLDTGRSVSGSYFRIFVKDQVISID